MFYESKNIAHWWTTTVDKNGVVFDHIFISYTNNNLMTYIPFKRIKTSCYNDNKEDYVVSYTPDVNFILLLGRLNKYAREHYLKKKAA